MYKTVKRYSRNERERERERERESYLYVDESVQTRLSELPEIPRCSNGRMPRCTLSC